MSESSDAGGSGAAAEFSFFLAMPTMGAAFVYELMKLRGHLVPGQATEIAVGFVFAFLAALAVVRPFLRFVARTGFAPFAWYRIAAGLLILAAFIPALLALALVLMPKQER